jgi:hypothetical protein
VIQTIVRPAYEAKFTELAGAHARAERQRLARDATVRKYLELERPQQLATIAEIVVENFQRYAQIQRMRLAGGISPLETGNQALLAARPDPTEFQNFVKDNRTPELERYFELSDLAEEAFGEAVDDEKIRRLTASVLMKGADTDLLEICIGTR